MPGRQLLMTFPVTATSHTLADYRARGGYATIVRVLREKSPAEVTKEVTASGIQGRGGAAFQAGPNAGRCAALVLVVAINVFVIWRPAADPNAAPLSHGWPTAARPTCAPNLQDVRTTLRRFGFGASRRAVEDATGRTWTRDELYDEHPGRYGWQNSSDGGAPFCTYWWAETVT